MSPTAFLFDTNLWLALTLVRHPFHAAAQAVYVSTNPAQPAVFCRATQNSFLRLLTTPAMMQPFGAALNNRDASAVLNDYLSKPNITFLQEPADVFPTWMHLAALTTASPKRWMDAYLAAFALKGNLQFVTTDKDFARFSGLQPITLPAPSITTPTASSGGPAA